MKSNSLNEFGNEQFLSRTTCWKELFTLASNCRAFLPVAVFHENIIGKTNIHILISINAVILLQKCYGESKDSSCEKS